jgi:uncharacterized protein
MKVRWCTGGILLAAMVLLGCRKSVSTAATLAVSPGPPLPTEAQPTLPIIKLWLGAEELQAEVAQTPTQIQTGMMFRTNLMEMSGMLFVLPVTGQTSFWMKNCTVPLSVAYIRPDGIIAEIHNLQPGNTNAVLSQADDIRFALEVNQGWFGRHQIATGMVVRTERGSLADTYLRGP